jgi:hypothetical protein
MQQWINQARRESNTPEKMARKRAADKLRRIGRTPEQKRKQAEADKKWRLANPERIRAIHKTYYENNREAIAAKSKARRERRKHESSN